MELKKFPHIVFLLLAFFICKATTAQQEKKMLSEIEELDEFTMLYKGIWKYKEGDRLEWADPEFNDELWDSVLTTLDLTESESKNEEQINQAAQIEMKLPDLGGVIWFRWTFTVPEKLKNKTVGVIVSQPGASEIYLDGKLVKSFGTPSDNPASEVVYNPNGLPVPMRFNEKDAHVIAVRYSNLKAYHNFKKYDLSSAGFLMVLGDYDSALDNFITQLQVRAALLIFLGTFSFTLALMHFVIYLFYRKKKNNLFYSIFMLSSSLFCFVTHFAVNQHDVLATAKMFGVFGYVVPVFLMAFLSVLYSLFYTKLPKMFWVMFTIMAVIILLHYKGNSDLRSILIVLFLLTVFVESFRVSLLAVIRKKRGARIVGGGVLFLLLTIVGFFAVGVISGGNINLSGSGIGEITVIVILILAVLSIPISMSIYLAWDISSTSKQLSDQLVEVERLSKEAIKQEHEKKVMLEKQNEVLEDQVAKRTKEITKQKELVETKNKEITDSITYAKRIQEAILPPLSLVVNELPENFILYKPKDIVAGDFYWLEVVTLQALPVGRQEPQGSRVLFAAADCTGHGVPGAMVSVVCHNALNRSVREFGLKEPGEILDKTREIVISEFGKSLDEVKDGMDIALCSLELFVPGSMVLSSSDSESVFTEEIEELRTRNGESGTAAKLQYAGAHNSLWIIRKGATEVEEIKANKQPIGMFVNPVPFDTHTIQLNKGDTLYVFSDGYVDQFGGAKAKKFKSVNFKLLLLSIQHEPLAKQKSIIEAAFDEWKGDLEQIDDVCIIGVRV